MAEAGRHRLFCLPRSANELSGTRGLPASHDPPLATRASVAQPRGRFTWKRIEKLAADFLPKPRILHPWPSDRFAVKHPRWEPYAGKLHVRICAGLRLVSAWNSVACDGDRGKA